MKQLKEFTIPFVGLKIGKHHFDYSIDQTFFNHFEYEDFNSCNIKVDLILEKKSTLLELHFDISGTVNVNCDVTNEPFDLPITTEFDLVVREKSRKQEEIREEHIIKQLRHKLQLAQQQVKLIYTTERTGVKVNFTTEVKF